MTPVFEGMSLKELPVDSFTVTEVLRLHFLASGAKGSDNNNRFRYQQRGAYTDHDDAGLEFRRQEVNIIKDLAEKNVFDLEPGEGRSHWKSSVIYVILIFFLIYIYIVLMKRLDEEIKCYNYLIYHIYIYKQRHNN